MVIMTMIMMTKTMTRMSHGGAVTYGGIAENGDFGGLTHSRVDEGAPDGVKGR